MFVAYPRVGGGGRGTLCQTGAQLKANPQTHNTHRRGIASPHAVSNKNAPAYMAGTPTDKPIAASSAAT